MPNQRLWHDFPLMQPQTVSKEFFFTLCNSIFMFSTKWNDHMGTCLWKCCKLKTKMKTIKLCTRRIYIMLYGWGAIFMWYSTWRLCMSTEKRSNARIQCPSFKCWHHITNKQKKSYRIDTVSTVFFCCKIQTSHSKRWPLASSTNMCMVQRIFYV